MAKKSRKRRRRTAPPRPADEAAGAPAPKAASPSRRTLPGERPPAPWGSFPLVEVAVAIALLMLVGGFVVGGDRGRTAVVAGLVIGSLAGLELSVREHFAGYRSHTLLLSGAAGLAVLLLLAYATPGLKLLVAMGAAALVFVGAAWVLTRAFRRRSGLSFKFR